jgi:eukaryotic-like serine/threonine-protein kinase
MSARVREIFLELLEWGQPESWDARLADLVGDDEPLRRQVEVLLAAHQQADSFLEHPAGPLGATVDDIFPAGGAVEPHGAPAEVPGAVLNGKYKLVEAIGAGGMGTVWMAQQIEPVKRLVAVKLIKPGMDSKQVLARFEAERQALALMDHPNIAKVLDASATATGRPYFVMDLVNGIPLTNYCDEHRLTPKERLELFVPVCQAIQHAHQKGIIHRDVKPSNVLVALYDGKPVPRVIDFGIAKATGPQVTEHTLVTGFGTVVGTLEYMSPEQAERNQLDIDTRSDIYSLGVLLYELLTGTTPLDPKRQKEAAMLELLRLIREEEPPRPSTRLSESKESLPTISAQRQTEPAKLTRLVRGELDWIVMKALDKDRARRYETANDFALDIQRYLADEPVQAGPPSVTYRLRKFVRRHRGPVLAGLLLLLALLLGIVGTTVGLVLAARAWQAEAGQRQQAENERDDKEKARALAAAKAQEAIEATAAERVAKNQAVLAKEATQQSLRKVEKANLILASIFRDLNPNSDENQGVPLRAQLAERLTRAAELLQGETVGDAERVARLQVLLGRTMTSLGYPEQAISMLTKGRQTFDKLPDAEPLEKLIILNDLAQAYEGAGKYELAVNLHRETFENRKTLLGIDHEDTLASMNNLGKACLDAGKFDLALALLTDALAKVKAKKGENYAPTLTLMNNLAGLYAVMGKLDLALPVYRDVLEKTKALRGPDHGETFTSMSNLAFAYREAGKLDLALALAQETVARCKAKFGPAHPQTLKCLACLADVYIAAGQLESALTLYLETLERQKVRLGASHPDTLTSMNNLAGLYVDLDKVELAVPLYREAVASAVASLGADHPHTLTCMSNLATAYRQGGKLDPAQFEEAVKLDRANLEKTKAKRGPDHPDTLRNMSNLAATYEAAGKRDLAWPLYRDTIDKARQKLGDDHPFTLATMNDLAESYFAASRPDLAVPLFGETLEKRQAKLGPDHPNTLKSMNNLAAAFAGVGKFDLAVPLYEEALEKMKTQRSDHNETITCTNNLADAYRATGKYDKAVPLFEAALAKKKARHGADHPGLLPIVNNLALTYHDSGQLDLALPLFIETLEKAKAKLTESHGLTLTIMNNLALTYRSNGQLDLALPLYRETLEKRTKYLGADHPDTVWSMNNLASTCIRARRYTEAEPLLLGWFGKQKQRRTVDDFMLARNRNALGECQVALKKFAEAEKTLRDSLAIFEEKEPKAILRYDTESQLGAALAGQKKFDEAEKFLIDSAKVMLKYAPRLSADSKRRGAAAVQRVIEFYTDRGNPAEADRWRKQRDEVFAPPPGKKEKDK